MKKVNFKKALMAFSIALTFLFLGVEHVSAQSSSLNSGINPSTTAGGNKALMAMPQGNFVDVDEALVLIENKMFDLKTYLTDTPGLPQSVITVMNRELNYYEVLRNGITNGMLVPNAIVNATITIVTDIYGAPQSAALTLKQGAVDLLTN